MAAIAENISGNWGLIAGNGDFPFLVLEGARSRGIDMAVIAIREEASPALEQVAKRFHWISLGELSRGIDLLHEEGVKHAVMAGQVKHNKIFSSIRPDWRLAKLLFALPSKNTNSLIGAVAGVLQDEGIELVDSTKFLGSLLPAAGILTQRPQILCNLKNALEPRGNNGRIGFPGADSDFRSEVQITNGADERLSQRNKKMGMAGGI